MKYDHLKNIHSLHGYIMEYIENEGIIRKNALEILLED